MNLTKTLALIILVSISMPAFAVPIHTFVVDRDAKSRYEALGKDKKVVTTPEGPMIDEEITKEVRDQIGFSADNELSTKLEMMAKLMGNDPAIVEKNDIATFVLLSNLRGNDHIVCAKTVRLYSGKASQIQPIIDAYKTRMADASLVKVFNIDEPESQPATASDSSAAAAKLISAALTEYLCFAPM